MENSQYDILIVGGGAVGAMLLLALQHSPYRVLLIDKPTTQLPNEGLDARSIALSPTSVAIFEQLGIWERLQQYAQPIFKIHVSQQNYFGKATLNAANKPLGYIVEIQSIAQVLKSKLENNQNMIEATLESVDFDNNIATIQTHDGEKAITAKLIVAADGVGSKVRTLAGLHPIAHDFLQTAVVANIALNRPHQGIAYERFTTDGPLALLPMQQNRMAMVFALPNQALETWLSYDDAAFLKNLQTKIGYRLGPLKKMGQRTVYPLKQVVMPTQHFRQVIFIGNAAHTLHPIAGQGLNLSLRDVAMLVEKIQTYGLSGEMMEHYTHARLHDQKTIAMLTQKLIETFGLKSKGMGFLRGLGLLAVDQFKPLQKVLSYYASGYAGPLSDLICGIAPNWSEVSRLSNQGVEGERRD